MRTLFLICLSLFLSANAESLAVSGLIYRNPQAYNVDYSFELVPDHNIIDRTKDLKLWIPIPREWDSQKAVKIISVQPPPHSKYEDPEHGNQMLFWDFGKEPEKPSYKVNLQYRLECYETHVEIDPNKIGTYDKTNKEYGLYTRSTRTVSITPKIKEMAREAIGDEDNPYLQAEQFFNFTVQKVRYKMHRHDRGTGTDILLSFPYKDDADGNEYYEGECLQKSALFVALCRSVGIPARAVVGFVGWRPWIKEKDLRLLLPIELELSPDGLAGAQHYVAGFPHVWSEFYLPDHGWIPVDVTYRQFGHLANVVMITSKDFDVQIGPDSPSQEGEGYGYQWIALNNGRVDILASGVWNIAKIPTAKVTLLHHSDPFPADAFTGYLSELYPNVEAEKKLANYLRNILVRIDDITRGQPKKDSALAQVYKDKPWLRREQEHFICHMLRKVVGDKNFFDIYKTFTNLRIKSGEPVSTEQFKKIVEQFYGKKLDWFFEQWLERNELPELKLENVTFSKEGNNWRIQGSLRQLSNSVFRLSIELKIETEKESEYRTLLLQTRNTDFEFSVPDKPKSIVVDPGLNILKIQKMP